MCSIPTAFDCLQCAYRGATDSINDVDVDPHGGCAYAASCSGDVLVWDVSTLQLKAQLRHSQWVNAVRCFPLQNSTASFFSESTGAFAVGVQPAPAVKSASPGISNSNMLDGAYADVCSRSEIRWVLTGCENGAVAVWSPMTYRTQSSCRPSLSAITSLQLLPCTPDPSNSGVGSCNSAGEAGQTCEPDSCHTDGAAFLCAASLRHIHILKVTSSTPQLVLLRSLQHTVLITAMVPLCASAALPTPLLAVGQEDGVLCLWNCSDWRYHDTLPYPAEEPDVEEDARLSPDTIHEPQWEHGAVLNTFAYNRRRCNSCADDDPEAEQLAAPCVSEQMFQREMPGAVSADAAALIERRCGALPADLQHVLQVVGTPGSVGGRETIPLAAKLRYDARRVTCLATNTGCSSGAHTHLYSGHATGEVLLWGFQHKGVPLLLLKKIILFKPGAWVWRMCAVKPLVTSIRANNAVKGAKAGNGKSKVLRGKAALATKRNASPAPSTKGLSTLYYAPLELIVWSDGGAVECVSTHSKQLTHKAGPGFMASAATCWIGGALPEVGCWSVADADAKTPATSPRSASGAVPLSSLVAHQYMLIGNFEGRVERFDVSTAMGLVKSFGKKL